MMFLRTLGGVKELMLGNINNKKGSTMLFVIVLMASVILLAGVLLDTSMQVFRASKTNGHMDYSYYAAESAIQKCFDSLGSICSNETLAASNGITYTGDNELFARSMVNEVLRPYIGALNINGAFDGINVANNTENTADVSIDIKYMGHSYNPAESPSKIKINIGVFADSKYIVKPYVSGDKKVFSQKEFEVSFPKAFRLLGPVYTVGDFMASGSSTLNVTGDMHVYGSSPEVLAQPEQYYYGGIYAKDNSTMYINGNAYSRSFIRTGEYNQTQDNSSIYVYRDAVAQGVHVFGRNNRIAVYRNAYTFDDLEINGEDSVIAINGSYFGLSDGTDAVHHDNSSAIVNSAIVHWSNSSMAKRSRIVINGSVMINGSTFRVETDSGDVLYEIEDASIAMYNDAPLYKLCPIDLTGLYRDWIISGGYDSGAYGYSNLFQVWNTRPWSVNPADVQANIESWMNSIDMARLAGTNNTNMFDRPVPEKIQGYCNYEIASNDRMYFISKSDEDLSELGRAKLLTDNYVLDNIDPPLGMGTWKGFWNGYMDDSFEWDAGYCWDIPGILNNLLKPGLLDMANVFVSRHTYDPSKSSASDVIEHRSTETFSTIMTALGNLALSGSPYVLEAGSGNLSDAAYPYNDIANNPWALDKYFLVINTDPDKILELNGTVFNGIIFTTGKVVLRNGAIVNGAIVAAGRGYDPGPGYVAGSAAEDVEIGGIKYAHRAPRIREDGSNLGVLDSGGYAAIQISSGEAGIHFPDADPETGREILLDIFLGQGLDLYSIF